MATGAYPRTVTPQPQAIAPEFFGRNAPQQAGGGMSIENGGIDRLISMLSQFLAQQKNPDKERGSVPAVKDIPMEFDDAYLARLAHDLL